MEYFLNPAYPGYQTFKDDRLKPTLEKIAAYITKNFGLPIDSIGISSAYRTPAQDRAVGGSGSGPHVSGHAVDAWMMYQGKAYNSIYALCAAQALAAECDIKGIERISDGVSFHIDLTGWRSSMWMAYQAKSGGRWVYYLVKDWYASSWAAAAGIKAASTTSKSRAVLKLGSKGSDVSDFQRAINKAYGTSALTVDGIYGAASVRACKAFQRDRGLAQDGICGSGTWKQLEEYLK